ncbi:MAG: LamG-like jellyroll fold domain-containing protein, partial [Planctomycetota bacterium]
FDLGAMSDDWLFSDYKVTSENYTTADANLLVEYLFEPNAAYDDLGNPWDSSGNAYHGVGINDPNIHDGVLTLDGDGNCVEIGGDFNTTTGNPFRGAIKGGGDFTIAMEFKTAVPSVLFSSSPYDPCVSDGPNNSDPSFHAMTIFMLPQEDDDPTLTYDNWHIDAATAIGTPTDGQWHLMVVTHDADGGIVEEDSDDETPGAVTGLTTMYLDGVPAGVTTMSAQPGDQGNFDPNLVDPCDHKILIGNTQHAIMPWEDAPDVVSMKGDIDNVRVWDTLLTPGQVANLMNTPPAQTFSAPVNSDAELYSQEAVGQRYVNFKDKAVLANNWLELFLWPSE